MTAPARAVDLQSGVSETLGPQPTVSRAVRSRIQSINALRGLIMIIMAIDHTREFIHAGAQTFSPEDLSRTTAILFFTQWVTHICAPVFMFTAGLGAFFWLHQRGRTKRDLAVFLVTRGLWLIVLEVVVIHFAMDFNFDYSLVILEVIWALGWCMILLAALVYLPIGVLATLSLATIALINLTDGVQAANLGSWAWLWHIVHEPGIIQIGGTSFEVAYTLVPWVAVMSAGYCFGRLMQLEPDVRRRWLLRIGIGLTALFVVLRAVDVYGDPGAWRHQKTALFTLLAFLRTTKYPPSLLFLLMTMGPALLILAGFDRRVFSRTNPLIVFGRVPLFFFVVHLFLIHAIATLLLYTRYGDAPFLFTTLPALQGPAAAFPRGLGYSLGVVYLIWIGVVLALYPVCRWYAGVKQGHPEWWWLSYL